MRVVAVTGASGYVGGLLVARLIADPEVEEVLTLDLHPPHHAVPEGVTFYRRDICEPGLGDLLRRHRVEGLVHAAFVLHATPRQLAWMERSNLQGTANVLRAAVEARVKRVVVLSSTTVYGAWPDNPVPLTEAHPPRPNPDYPYGVHKGRLEEMCRALEEDHPEIACAVLRPPGIVGPHFHGPLADLWRRRWAILIDGGRAPGQFVHEADVVDLILRALRAGARGVFNATPDDWLPWREIWTQAGKQPLNLPWPVARRFFGLVWRLGLFEGATHPAQVGLARFPFVASNERARRELGWRPRRSTVEAIRTFTRGSK
ncbi:MAG TPA: NAD-dependent epimerase/dehydratase family protein [Chloroflexi bacterium]|nr:NAD-dependent epimerase/dehydratase family protein [Chloroflexota bacterium]